MEFRKMQAAHLRVVAENGHTEIGPAQISGEYQGGGFWHRSEGF